ncbi:MAG: FemAB family PEP-CTERM system-associated protein [Planctomycetes bacterium]|nr:FemAB family PEP-CTERM system-associated protein [Planctomycetota bacterium]
MFETGPAAVRVLEPQVCLRVWEARDLAIQVPRVREFVFQGHEVPQSRDPAWLHVLQKALGHEPILLEACRQGTIVGVLPLALVRSWLFGRFLVGLPYLNYGGVFAANSEVAAKLVDAAVALAEKLHVRYLELRHEEPLSHELLPEENRGKVHMRLALPETAGVLWDRISAKVRNQIRKGQKQGFETTWGGQENLADFYQVFCRNMRDLGTPAYGRRLFREILSEFPDSAEICVLRADRRPVAAALLLHGKGVTEVPSASSLRQFNSTCANMLMYWQLLERAIQRRQTVFDFGRSSVDSSTFRFKKQWGAEAFPACWQYHLRVGQINQARPDNPRYQRFIRIWQRLPVWLTRWVGPWIVRGIP